MGSPVLMIWRLLVPLLAGMVLVLTDVSVAHAQASACVQLESALNQLDRNSDFRDSRQAREFFDQPADGRPEWVCFSSGTTLRHPMTCSA